MGGAGLSEAGHLGRGFTPVQFLNELNEPYIHLQYDRRGTKKADNDVGGGGFQVGLCDAG